MVLSGFLFLLEERNASIEKLIFVGKMYSVTYTEFN